MSDTYKLPIGRPQPPPPSPYKVHFVYLIPTDKTNFAQFGISRAAVHLQKWYRWQMGGKTFTLTPNVVEVYQTTHDSTWYPNNVNGTDPNGYFWNNTLQDLSDLAGGGFYQQFDDWVVYIDAEPGPGQYVGGASGGYTSGVSVLPAQDCRGVQGVDPVYTVCRSIGGCGHELGHTFGLPHPDGDPNFGIDLMGTGYTVYPNAQLTVDEVTQLSTNPFFTALPDPSLLDNSCSFNDHKAPR